MIPEFGQLALNFAFFISLCLAVIPLVGSLTGRVVWMASCRSLATGVFIFVGIVEFRDSGIRWIISPNLITFFHHI